jgi:hypothetical protein
MKNSFNTFESRGRQYIAHHGISGQKWGVQNGPPYPLDYDDHTKVEKQKNPQAFISAGEEKKESKDAAIRKLLKKNPNAAVVNPSLKDWAKAHKKELMFVGAAALAVGGGIAAAHIYKHKNKLVDEIDLSRVNKVKDFIDDNNNVPISGEFDGFHSNEERFIAQWFKADIHRFDPITEDEYAAMSDDKIILDAGTKLYRMSKNEHSTLRDGIEYVSFGEDRQRYKGFLPQMWNANDIFAFSRRDKFYEAELSALTQIKAPGKKESIEILAKAWLKHNHLSDRYMEQSMKSVLKDFYQLQLNLIDRNNPLCKLYFEEAKRRGYNAVVDWNDAGRLADAPLILIDASKQARVDNVKLYSLRETREVFKNIKLPSNITKFTLEDWKNEPKAALYEWAIAKFIQ